MIPLKPQRVKSGNNPAIGWHDIHCFMCGKPFETITHHGGTQNIKTCPDCESHPGLNVCFDCWSGSK